MKKIKLFFGIGISILCLFCMVGCGLTEEAKKPTQIDQEPTIIEVQSEITETYKKISSGCVGVYATSSTSGSVGSGVVYKEVNGLYYVVTNHHVIENMTTVRIYRGGSRYLKAKVVGSDAKNDIAVLTFSLDLFGGDEVYIHDIFSYDDEIVSVGQTVLAIGCPLGLDNFNTLTTGVVSRVTSSKIQTNAEINPGNSGGGLFNVSGRLIGINTQKEIYTQGEENGVSVDIPVEGLGYAIQLDVVKKCITDIENKNGDVDRPLLGITIIAVNRFVPNSQAKEYVYLLPNTVDQALVITDVNDGVAKKAGLLANDVILTVNDVEIVFVTDLSSILDILVSGNSIVMEIYRPSLKETMTFTIVLE